MRIVVTRKTGSLSGQARLARTTRPGQREQADVLPQEQPEHLRQLLLTAQERRRGDRQIRLVKALERREVNVSELVDPLGRRQILQPVHAQIAQPLCAQ